MSELKRCPFCKSTNLVASHFEEEGGDIVDCYACNARAAGGLWNTRPIEDELRAKIDKLELLVRSMHPDNAPKDAWPLMLYFGSDAERQEFVRICEKAIPGMWTEALHKT